MNNGHLNVISYSWIEGIKIIKVDLSKLISKSNINLVKEPDICFCLIQKIILKFIWKKKMEPIRKMLKNNYSYP